LGCTTGEYNSVKLFAKFGGAYVDTDVDSRPKFCPFLFHLFDSAIDVTLFHFEFWDAVTKQTADPIGSFENDNRVASACQLLRSSEASWPAADDGDRFI
jgi:hypothetical protein